jgi:2,3-bisphosphoglycerate-independent phosphoglycerate mutase
VRRVNIVLPGLVGANEDGSVLLEPSGLLAAIVGEGRVVRLAPMLPAVCPEAAFLGLDPAAHPIAQGPLTVAALGAAPPETSVHFHLSLCSVDEDGRLQDPGPVEGLREVMGAAQRLNSRALTPLEGEGRDHALVWEEGSTELETTPIVSALGGGLFSQLPRGEGEDLLRKFVDDSVNLLGELESNHVRREEGLPPLNCLWPWGQGFRPRLPNLPLRRGDVAFVESGSLRLLGLCRLVGYGHGDRHRFGTGLKTDFSVVRDTALGHRVSLALVEATVEMRKHGRLDEIAYTLQQLESEVLAPLFAMRAREPFELRIASAGDSMGLGLLYRSDRPGQGALPFDERVLDDGRAPFLPVWEFLRDGFVGELASQ